MQSLRLGFRKYSAFSGNTGVCKLQSTSRTLDADEYQNPPAIAAYDMATWPVVQWYLF